MRSKFQVPTENYQQKGPSFILSRGRLLLILSFSSCMTEIRYLISWNTYIRLSSEYFMYISAFLSSINKLSLEYILYSHNFFSFISEMISEGDDLNLPLSIFSSNARASKKCLSHPQLNWQSY